MGTLEDAKALAYHDKIIGFDDEVGMIHSIAHHFEHCGVKEETVGQEYTCLPQPIMGVPSL